MGELRSANRTHAPDLERTAENQRPKTGDWAETKLYRYDGTDLYQWFGRRVEGICRSPSVFWTACDEPFVIESTRPRTEGRGDEPVASDKALFDALWDLVAAIANEGIPKTPRTKAAFKVAHQAALDRLRKDWSSPIREPEISRTILGDPCTLEACPPGLFIADAYNTLGMKSEYRTEQGAIEAYIVESGEFFWGDNPQTVERQRAQIVRPISHADAILNLAPVGGRGEETAWLIERQDLAPYPLYMRQTPRGHSWTPDPNEAARFATKEQASAECCGGDERGPLKVTEHMWCAAPPPQQEQGGMK